MNLVQLAANLAAGTITQDWIKSELGEGVLNSVLAIGGGIIAGSVANELLTALDDETGIMSDLGSLVDDVLDIF